MAETMTFIVAGRRRTAGSKPKTVYAIVGEEDGKERYFGKRVGAGSIGTRYSVEVENGGDRVYIDTARHLGRIGPDDPRLVEWVAADEHAAQEAAKTTVERKASEVEPLEGMLATISAMSHGLNRSERRALASRLLEAVWV